MDFAVTACKLALPDAGVLRDHMLGAWEELRDACMPERAAPAPTARVSETAPVKSESPPPKSSEDAATVGERRAA